MSLRARAPRLSSINSELEQASFPQTVSEHLNTISTAHHIHILTNGFLTSFFTITSDVPERVPEQELDTDIPEGAVAKVAAARCVCRPR